MAALGAGSAALLAQSIPVDVELGYRFVDVSGNDQMYRTQINDRPGLLLRSLDFTGPELLGGGTLLDTLHVDASDVGAGPAGRLRFVAGQNEIFQLRFSWRETDLYSALPAFANPFLDQGIIPGQQTWNRIRNIYDARARAPARQDRVAAARVHAQHLRRPRHHDLPSRRERIPAEPAGAIRRPALPRRRRVQLRRNPGGLHAGLADVRLEVRRDARAGGRQRQRHDADPRPAGHGRCDRRHPEQQDQHAGDQRLDHRDPLRAREADRHLHQGGREQRDELRRGGRRKVPVLRDRPVLLGPGRDGRLPIPDRLLEGLGAGRSQHHQQRRPRRRLGREQPVPRRAGADLAALPGHGHVCRPEHRRPAARGQRPHRRRRHEPGLRRRNLRPRARPLLRQRRLVPDPADRDRDARRRRDRRSGRTGRPLRAPRQHLGGRRHVRRVRRDADRRLPPRRRRRSRFSGPTTSIATGTASAAPGPTRTS